jgi:hypothetical protein
MAPPLFQEVASIASERAGEVTAVGCLAPHRLRPDAREPREDAKTFQTQGEPRRMTIITGLLFEKIFPSRGPTWSVLAVGYAVIGLDGQVYLTDAGAEYLAWVGA